MENLKLSELLFLHGDYKYSRKSMYYTIDKPCYNKILGENKQKEKKSHDLTNQDI